MNELGYEPLKEIVIHMCCLECPDFDGCPVQCEFLDSYEFVENCPDYVKEEEE